MLNSAKLKNEILAEIQAKGFKLTPENQKFIEALASCIIKHITANAVVAVTTSGSPTNHTGTGTIS